MAHAQQLTFFQAVKNFFPSFFEKNKVLEVGSLDINGSVRGFFSNCDYTGIDVGEGKSVDVVCPGQNFAGDAHSFDAVVSLEAMEHNPYWRETWVNMLRLVRPGGLVVMTCATLGRRQHGTTEFNPADSPLTHQLGQNYYQNLTQQDFEGIINHAGWFCHYGFSQDHETHDLYFWGVRHGASAEHMQAASNFGAALRDYYHNKNILGAY